MSHYLLLTHFIFLALVVCVQRDVTSVVKWSRRLYYDIRLCLLGDLSLRAQVRKQVSVRPTSYIGLCRLQGSLSDGLCELLTLKHALLAVTVKPNSKRKCFMVGPHFLL